jgi:NitT/TauT family transport system permease protein
MGATKTQIFRLILLWESMPHAFVGIKSAVSLSLVIIIVTEMFIGTRSGLGKAIIDAQITYEIKTMYAIILLVGILGYILSAIFTALEKKFFHWSGKL